MAKKTISEASAVQKPDPTPEMRRLWRGGERRRAAELAMSVNPTAKQRNDWAAEFDGILEIGKA